LAPVRTEIFLQMGLDNKAGDLPVRRRPAKTLFQHHVIWLTCAAGSLR